MNMDSSNALTAFEPANLSEALKVADIIAKSELIPKDLRGKPQNILLVLWKGRELGLSAMQAISSIHIIEGKTSLSGELIVAQCLKHSDVCEHFTLDYSDTAKATYTTKRKGSPKSVTLTYSMEDAQRAKLAHKDNWQRMPATMLRWRAASALAKAVYPELTLGLYTPDEADEIRGGVASPPAAEEKPLNEPPNSTTESVKAKLKSKFLVVDVAPGQTEADAIAALDEAPQPTAYERCAARAREKGLTDGRRFAALIRGATGGRSWKEVVEADVDPIMTAIDIATQPVEG